jgi:hypothetical protein
LQTVLTISGKRAVPTNDESGINERLSFIVKVRLRCCILAHIIQERYLGEKGAM